MNETRIRHIDGLRGIAVLGVVLYHTWWLYPAWHNNYWLNIVLDAGRHGVELFFVLSGFCLSYPVLASLESRGAASFDVVKYGARRLVRILPPYYAAILTCTAIVLAAHISGVVVTIPDLVRQAIFFDNGTHLVNTAFWTLALEFRWYFLFPIALLLWTRSPRVFSLLILGVVLLWSTRATSTDLLYLPGFLVGIVAAHWYVFGSRFARFAAPFAALAVVAAAAIDPNRGLGGKTDGFDALWMPASFLFVVGAGAFAPLRRLCSSRWLVATGVASYSLYLVHMPVLFAIQQRAGSPWAALAAEIAFGVLFWAVAERPFVSGSLRAPIIRALESRLASYAGALGLGRTMVLNRLPAAEQRMPKVAAEPRAIDEPVSVITFSPATSDI